MTNYHRLDRTSSTWQLDKNNTMQQVGFQHYDFGQKLERQKELKICCDLSLPGCAVWHVTCKFTAVITSLCHLAGYCLSGGGTHSVLSSQQRSSTVEFSTRDRRSDYRTKQERIIVDNFLDWLGSSTCPIFRAQLTCNVLSPGTPGSWLPPE